MISGIRNVGGGTYNEITKNDKVRHKSRVTNCELQVTSHELKA